MMENKVLVTILVPSLEKTYDMFIPVNKRIYEVINLIKESLNKLSLGALNINDQYNLYSENTGDIYDINSLIRDTDIRNDTRIIML